MHIDMNKQYRTRDGRAVRIYATDGAMERPIHGAVLGPEGWWVNSWYPNGTHGEAAVSSCLNLIEVTLADELRDQIPWSALRPEIQWVAVEPPHETGGGWLGFTEKPFMGRCLSYKTSTERRLDVVAMPEVDPGRWQETLIERP